MSEKFWKHIWFLVACICALFILSVSACNMHIDYRIAQAIKNGTAAEEARYAFSNANRMSDLAVICLSQKRLPK